jgi:hypothetical protein
VYKPILVSLVGQRSACPAVGPTEREEEGGLIGH